jgi:hypothetical protein
MHVCSTVWTIVAVISMLLPVLQSNENVPCSLWDIVGCLHCGAESVELLSSDAWYVNFWFCVALDYFDYIMSSTRQ